MFQKNALYILIFSLCLSFSHAYSQNFDEEDAEETFSRIYESKHWSKDREKGTSGFGSTLEATVKYRAYLQKFLKSHDIHSVVDVGCGDWEFSQAINWNGISYIGYDIVKPVIQKNQQKFSSANIQFVHCNAIESNLPSADLLICKDVLQHLPIGEILLLLSQFDKFKYCLITNDVDPNTLTGDNIDIIRGSERSIDLSKSPFDLIGKKVLTYSTGQTVKQVFLIENH